MRITSYQPCSRQKCSLTATLLYLMAPIAVLFSPQTAQAEKRLIVGGIDKDGHFSYAFKPLGTKPLLHVDATAPNLPKTVTIKNETRRKVKVLLYKGDDPARLVAKQTATLEAGKSLSLPFQVLHVKVFLPGIIDTLLVAKLFVSSDISLLQRGKTVAVETGAVPTFSVTNKTSDTLHANIYNPGDGVRALPRKTIVVKPGAKVTWADGTLPAFQVRIHEATVLGAALSARRSVNVRSAIVITQRDWSPWKKLLESERTPRWRETDRPKNLSQLKEVTYARDDDQDNHLVHYLFSRLPDGSLWAMLLRTFPLYDGSAAVHRSTDWNLAEMRTDQSPKGQIAGIPLVTKDNSSNILLPKMRRWIFTRGAQGRLLTREFDYNVKKWDVNGDWTDLGGQLDTYPSVIFFNDTVARQHQFMAFIRHASNHTLQLRSRDTSLKWSEWSNLGGSIQDTPCATKLPHQVHVFARGQDNTLQRRILQAGKGWQAWESLGGTLASAPVAVLIRSGASLTTPEMFTAHVFALAPAGNVIYRYFNGTKWSDWKSLGSNFRSAPIVFFSDDAG